MNSDKYRLRAREYVSDLAAAGKNHFVSADARKALNVSAIATKLALNRLIKHKLIAQPARGFYVIVPPEYRTLECLPLYQFIPALMKKLDQHCYVGYCQQHSIMVRHITRLKNFKYFWKSLAGQFIAVKCV